MTKMMTLPAANVPHALNEGVAAAFAAHGLSITPDLLDEVVQSAAKSLIAIDESLVAAAEPSMADRLTVGETLRSLAMMGRPNAGTARALERVGTWLTRNAKAELAKDVEAA